MSSQEREQIADVVRHEVRQEVKVANNPLRTTVITCTVIVSLFMIGVLYQLGAWHEQSASTYTWRKTEAEPKLERISTNLAVINTVLKIKQP